MYVNLLLTALRWLCVFCVCVFVPLCVSFVCLFVCFLCLLVCLFVRLLVLLRSDRWLVCLPVWFVVCVFACLFVCGVCNLLAGLL